MDDRYLRNQIYVTPEEQGQMKQYKLFLGGAGVGSVIAECALRFGFENITIADGDRVELTNLNRQNYSEDDLGEYKSVVLAKRLMSINKNAKIQYHTCFIDSNNVSALVAGHHVAINALDFSSAMPFLFDNVCRQADIPVLHPYNIGWAGLVAVVKPDSPPLTVISETYENFELKMVEYVTQYLKFWHESVRWIEDVIQEYKNKQTTMSSPPQLSVASWVVAGLCTQLMFCLCTNKPVKAFPDFYLTSVSGGNI